MIKICYVIGQLSMDGAERQLYELVRGINKEKFFPVVISLSQGGYWAKEIRDLNIQVIEIPRKKNKEFARLIKLIKLFTTIKPDIVHTYMFPANCYGRIAAIICKVPIIIASERNLPEIGKDKNLYKIFVDKLLVRFSHGIICNSYKASDLLINKYSFNKNKVFTVHNGINVSDFYKQRFSNKNNLSPKVIGTIGRLYPQKNHRLFLDMAKAVLDKSENGNIKFVIVGEGPLKSELKNYSRKLDIENSVVFTGKRIDIPELLNNMYIFVMTSLYEGLSNTIMEAMLAGLPVVATDVGGNNELIVNGETGFLCTSNDAIALAEKIIGLINNEGKAKQMGGRGEKRIIDKFGIQRMIKETEGVYTKLLGKECSF